MAERILIVEDEPIQSEMVCRMLEHELGATTTVATDGPQALALLGEEQNADIALALFDLRLPSMDGFDLLRALPGLKVCPPVIVLTASESIDDVIRAMQLGALDFIPKPTQRQRLLASVKNVLAIGALMREVRRLQAERVAVLSDGRLRTIAEIEAEVIARALERCNGHVGRTAQMLGMGQSTLYKRRKSA
ncbi:MAG: DNA-binding response regulator [Alphaproteobacteria bacterium]